MGDVERPIGVGERPAVADVQLEAVGDRERRRGEDGRGEDLGPAVDGHDRQAARPRRRPEPSSASGMSAPPVPTSSRVSSCAMGGQGVDRAARSAVTPPSQRLTRRRSRRLPTSAAGSSSGPSSSSTASVRRSIAGRVRRARTIRTMIVVAGEALIDLLVRPDGPADGHARRRPVQHRADDRPARWRGRVPRLPVDRPVRRAAARRPGRRRRRPVDDRDDRRADDAGRRRPRRGRRGDATGSIPTGTSAPRLSPGAVRDALASHARGVPSSARSVSCWSRWPPRSRGAMPAVRRGTLVMLDPNCRPRRHHRPGGLPRPARRDRRPQRRRQGQRRRPRLPRAGRRAGRRRARRSSIAGRRVVLVTDGRRPVIAVMPDRRPRDPRAGGRRRRHGRCRRRLRWRVPRPLDRARLGRAALADTGGSSTRSGSPSRSRPSPAAAPGPTRRAETSSAGPRAGPPFARLSVMTHCRPPPPADRLRPARCWPPRLPGPPPPARRPPRSRTRAWATAAPTSGPSRACSGHTAARSRWTASSAPRPATRSRRSRRRKA